MMKATRRGFLKGAGATAAVAMAMPVDMARAAVKEARELPDGRVSIFITNRRVEDITEIPHCTLAHEFDCLTAPAEAGGLKVSASGVVWRRGFATHFSLVNHNGLVATGDLQPPATVMADDNFCFEPFLTLG